MRVKKASKFQKILTFIISMLLMFFTIVSILSLSLNFIILNSNTYYKVLEKEEIYNKIYDVIDENISYALTLNNLPQDINKDIIYVEEVKVEVDRCIGDIIRYLRTGINDISKVNIDTYMERFNRNVNEVLQSNSIEVTSEIKAEIILLENDIRQIIKSQLQIINVDVIENNEVFSIITKITSLFVNKVYLLPVVFVGICSLLLYAIWKSNYVGLLQWIGNGFISAGLMIFLIFFSGYISKFYEYTAINIMYLKDFVAATIKLFLGTLSLWGGYLILLGLVLITPKIKQAIKLSKMRRK